MLWEDCAPRGRRTRFTPPSARACSRCLRPEALRQKGKDPVPHVDDVARRQICVALAPVADQLHILALAMQRKIGSASCRERVCQYVSIWVVAVSLKKKKIN